MADPAMSVTPYWELTFDADGDVSGPERDRLLAEVPRRGVRDLVVFAHGWNNDRSGATRLYSSFFAPFPQLAPAARIGYVGVVWPSMRFSDEPIPDFPRSVATETPRRPALDKDTRHALLETFPGRGVVVEQLARLLEQRPREEAELTEFGRLVRLLVEVVPPGPQALFAADTLAEGVPQDEPEMFTGSAAAMCETFAQALADLESPDSPEQFTMPDPWEGAHELLRQGTYYAMKRRAGTVGERGLGRFLGQLADAAPQVRVHLVGHSFGGRLVSFALRGLPEGVRTVKSVTLLQGAFSHYAFAARLPHDPRAGGVLQGQNQRVDGPLVCCWSSHDTALGTLYPLASRMAGDAQGVAEGFDLGRLLGDKWGAMGHDGVQAVPGTRALTLADALGGPLPGSGCVNVDASAVVCRGGPPSGAHSDIVHPELARVVLAAGRIR
ncbi:serine-threonine protein kinase [Streptomyces adustus]|uniref:Serine-threonine protein kinase n=1 Tax=Streptomyces adustus TaxID=1609272 RepID=A0A5N8VD60_9ACTN|nr:serine-threonine protein kinase [Streptomyces adustus]MPY33183.1 serine-threonine protein kinase [Streptomyces adustus]